MVERDILPLVLASLARRYEAVTFLVIVLAIGVIDDQFSAIRPCFESTHWNLVPVLAIALAISFEIHDSILKQASVP
jgi:hypothetical protein